MPLLANKPYILNKARKDKKDDDSILYNPITNEICDSIEELSRKIFLYNQRIWSCRITNQSNLTFKEAQKSEQACSKLLKNSLKKCFEPVVLQYVHHSRESLENIIHKAWTQMHEEYCINEAVVIKLPTPKKSLSLGGVVVKVDKLPHEQNGENESFPNKVISDASSSDKENIKKKFIPIKKNYHYSVKLFEMDKLVNDIPSETIERTLRPPSKDHIKMFIRAHATRHSGKPSNPWIVDDDFVKKYKLPILEPEFVVDKLRMKEISLTVEIQIYNKLLEDTQDNNSNNNNCVSTKAAGEKKIKVLKGIGKKRRSKIPGKCNGSSTLVTNSTKKKSPYLNVTRTVPPLAQELMRLIKEDKTHYNVNRLLIKCCQFTDVQISRLPDLIRIPIKEKKEKLELNKKLKKMTQEERDVFMAARRIELKQKRKEEEEKKMNLEDDFTNCDSVANGVLVIVNEAITQDQWARLLSLSEFVRCFKGLLCQTGLGEIGNWNVNDFCRAVIGSTDREREMLADIVCLFLKPLLQDSKLKKKEELGVCIAELPLTACTAAEILRLVLPITEQVDDDDNINTDKTDNDKEMETTDEATTAHNNAVTGPICDKLACMEMHELAVPEKIAVLELLQNRILELDTFNSYIEESHREATEAYKKRQVDNKELNDRLKVIRADLSKLKAAGINNEETETPLTNVASTKRRVSLEVRNRETEEKDRVQSVERQVQRLEKEESQCKRMIEQAQESYSMVVGESRQVMRVQPLGVDRINRRYWVFKTVVDVGVYVETVDNESTSWTIHDTEDRIVQLIGSLSDRSTQESHLKRQLQAVLPRLKEQLQSSQSKPLVTESTETVDGLGFLVRGFQEELRETQQNIRLGSLGCVRDYDNWSTRLSEVGSIDDMRVTLLAVFRGVHQRFWSVLSVLKSEFRLAVSNARTKSRLCVLQCVLDDGVCWDKASVDDRCRVCRRLNHEESLLLCDGCNRAYHTFCVRPRLRKVPEGEWLCVDCDDGRHGGLSEMCCVCQCESVEDGDCVGKCALCARWYHARCHEPPLRHVTGTRMRWAANWACSECRTTHKVARKGRRSARVSVQDRSVSGSDDNPDDDQSQQQQSSLSTSPVTRKREAAVSPTSSIGTRKRRKVTKDSKQDCNNSCIDTILREMISYKSSKPFREPVDPGEVPDYYSIISTPMDLSELTMRLDSGEYSSAVEGGLQKFLDDMAQMFTNAELYNEPDSKIVKTAHRLELFFQRRYSKCELGLEYVRKETSLTE